MESNQLSHQEIRSFQDIIWQHYAAHGRSELPWRQVGSDGKYDPYKIIVSEMMLQQTQVMRVISKYIAFCREFPDIHSLASVELGQVLRAWQGLGYNRRAKYLWQSAQVIENDYNGIVPTDIQKLTSLPGIGHNTAGAILAYAFNMPIVYVETNIRTVYIHHFFSSATKTVSDKVLSQLVSRTLPADKSIREWYWALMDYGTFIKQSVGNLNKISTSYAKQSRFEGSKRQLRGRILRMLSNRPKTIDEMSAEIPDQRIEDVLKDLTSEGLIRFKEDRYSL